MMPKRFNYATAFLTLRCNLDCSYCINDDSGVVRNRKELTGDEWISAINRIDFGKLPLTLTGGEPTLHKDFYQIVKETKVPLDMITNLQFDVDEFIEKTDPKRFRFYQDSENSAYRSIRASFHPERMSVEDTVNNAVKLQDAGFKVGIFSLNVPQNTEKNMQMAERARQEKMYFFIQDFLGVKDGRLYGNFKYPEGLDGKLKHAECRTKELLIDPKGDVFPCHRHLYHNTNKIGNINDVHFRIKDEFRSCEEYGGCNPCDVKLKTNRFLQMGSCSVEIK